MSAKNRCLFIPLPDAEVVLMGETDVRDPVGRVVAVLRDAGRAEGTVRSYRVVLDRFQAFMASRGLQAASDGVCVEFIAEETGVRLRSLREPVRPISVGSTQGLAHRNAVRCGLAIRPGSWKAPQIRGFPSG